MKKIILAFITVLFSCLQFSAQVLEWVPSKYSDNGLCEDKTECEDNIICYDLKYTPSVSGIVTSYTTGFLVDCQDGQTVVVDNMSCVLNDNSKQVSGCQKFGKILLNCSGHVSGNEGLKVKEGKSVYLHQVCFKLSKQQSVLIAEDKTTDLTLSLDTNVEKAEAVTEFPQYRIYKAANTQPCVNSIYWIELEAEETSDGTLLKWIMPESKEQGGIFYVEKSKIRDSFINVKEVNEKNWPGQEKVYNYLDTEVPDAKVVYRISYHYGINKVLHSNEVSIGVNKGRAIVKIFPNPGNQIVYMETMNRDIIAEYVIKNDSDQIVSHISEVNSDKVKINVDNLYPGNYVILLNINGEWIQKKLLVFDK